jgi:hypothetical protein
MGLTVLTAPPIIPANWTNAPAVPSPPNVFPVRQGAQEIDPELDVFLTRHGILASQSTYLRQYRADPNARYGHQKYPPPEPRIMEPSPLSEGSTANLGQSSVAEQAEAIRVVGALSEAQIRGLHRDRLADIFFLMFLHGLDPFAGQRPLNGRVLSAYAASPLSDEAPSVSRMLSQFQNLNAAVQSSAANYRQAYPGA